MSDVGKTKEQLTNELTELRRRIAELETLEADRKRAEETLWDSEAELSAIYESAPLVMVLMDREYRVQKVNYTATKFTGHPAEEMIGLRGGEALRCLHSLDSPRGCGFGPSCKTCTVRRTVMDTFETGNSHHQVEAKISVISRAGEMTLLVSTTILRLRESEMVLVSFEDITKRKRAEEELRRHRDHLEELVKERTAELAKTNKQLQRQIIEHKRMKEELLKIAKLESVGVLASGIAHDFNNLLVGIMGNIGLARRHVEPKSKAEDRLLEAEKAAIRAKDLTQQLLTFSRGGAPVKKTTSVAELLKDSASFALKGSNVRCEFSLPDNLWAVEIDEGQMNQVISNLVINADEAMPQGGILNIGAKNTVIKKGDTSPMPRGNYVEMTVEDHGIGISKEYLGRIFDPYFTTKQKGSGLGLATTYSIIKNHDGYITAESELGVGTTFRIYLPASKKPTPVVEKEAAAETCVAGKGRVLVMDDEEIIREMISKMLPLTGYEVELTKDGAEAIEVYRKAGESGHPFDVVILDLTVPGGMSGKEAVRKLLEINPSIKAIVSSGYSTDPIMADFKKYGFSAVVTKPYSVGELERTLHSILKTCQETI